MKTQTFRSARPSSFELLERLKENMQSEYSKS